MTKETREADRDRAGRALRAIRAQLSRLQESGVQLSRLRQSGAWLSRTWVALCYAGALLIATLVMRGRGPGTVESWLGWSSTNLANLSDHPVGSMITSAFLSDGDVWTWSLLAVLGIGVLAWAAGPLRAGAVALGAHVVATAISEGILAWRICSGAEPAGYRYVMDVGPSYIVVASLTAATVTARGWMRLATAVALGLVLPSMFQGLPELNVAAVGHLSSVLLGVSAGIWLRRRPPAAPTSGRAAEDGVRGWGCGG